MSSRSRGWSNLSGRLEVPGFEGRQPHTAGASRGGFPFRAATGGKLGHRSEKTLHIFHLLKYLPLLQTLHISL